MIARNLKLGLAAALILLASCGGSGGNDPTTVGPPSPNTGEAATIVFSVATPSLIAVRGFGKVETAILRFLVRNAQGNAARDGITVNFTLTGPGQGKSIASGGEYIGEPDGTPTTASATTLNGIVEIPLNSGNATGTATVTASVVTAAQTVIGLSNPVPIVGSRAASNRFGLASSRLNIPGFNIVGASATITASATDRLGNTAGLIGNLVSFYTEAGRIGASATLNSSGQASVTYLTGPTFPGFPNPGRVTIMAVMNGEEDFSDTNGNGAYDIGEPINDDVSEPFIDSNASSVWDPGEVYFDNNGNGVYTGPNGVWDGPGCPAAGCVATKQIWADIELALSSQPYCYSVTGPTVPESGTLLQSYLISDVNGNSVVSGTTVTVSAVFAPAGIAILGGTTSFTVPDAITPVPITFSLTDLTTAADPDGTYTVTIIVTPPVSSGFSACSTTITGTVQ